MPQFSYTAVGKAKERVQGVVQADDFRSAARAIEDRDLVLTELDEVRLASKKKQSKRKKISKDELILIFYEVVTMLRGGVGLKDVVEALCNSDHSEAVLEIFSDILKKLKEGNSFSLAVKSSNLSLPDYMHFLIEAGEITGSMAEAIEQGLQQLEYDKSVRENIKSALIYPSILVTSGIVAVGIMFLFVVPKFSSLLESAEEMPFLGWAVLSTGIWVDQNIAVVLIGAGLLCLVAYLSLRNERAKAVLVNILSRVPIVGPWLNEVDIAVWSRMVGGLLKRKVAILDALSLASKSVRMPWRRLRLAQVKAHVKSGMPLSESLQVEGVVTPTALNLIRVGEKSGELASTLESVSTLYDQAGKKRMSRLLALIEPVAILCIGSAIGIVIMGIILAITSANDIAI